MAMTADEIRTYIQTALPDATIELVDLAGDNDHWKAIITSHAFIGKSRVSCHQMVYKALQGHMGGRLHALSLETHVPKD